jgi:hypothetical protein
VISVDRKPGVVLVTDPVKSDDTAFRICHTVDPKRPTHSYCGVSVVEERIHTPAFCRQHHELCVVCVEMKKTSK